MNTRQKHIFSFSILFLGGFLLIIISILNLTIFNISNKFYPINTIFDFLLIVSLLIGILLFFVGCIGLVPWNIPKKEIDNVRD